MITEHQPEHWRDLQNAVARILAECGMQSEVEKPVLLARGGAVVDVVALETIQGRTSTIYCECKLWKSPIPQSVVHGFRTVIADGGATLGYIITSSAFQSGAVTAAELTNLRLVTWEDFQAEFEHTWFERYLRPEVSKRLNGLMTLVEPILPLAFHALSERAKAEYVELRERYSDLGSIAVLFSPYLGRFPELPLRDRFIPSSNASAIPSELLDATAYRDLLDILVPYGERAAAHLSAVLRSEATSSSDPNRDADAG